MGDNPYSHYRSSGRDDRDQKYDRRDVHRNGAPPQSDERVSRPLDLVHREYNSDDMERGERREGRRYRPRSPSPRPLHSEGVPRVPRYQSRSTRSEKQTIVGTKKIENKPKTVDLDLVLTQISNIGHVVYEMKNDIANILTRMNKLETIMTNNQAVQSIINVIATKSGVSEAVRREYKSIADSISKLGVITANGGRRDDVPDTRKRNAPSKIELQTKHQTNQQNDTIPQGSEQYV